MKICITPECGSPRIRRGLCRNCAQALWYAKKKGVITDERAVQLGLALSKTGGATGRPSKFSVAMRAKLAERNEGGAK